MFCVAGNLYGQTPPKSVTLDSKNYYQHGYNSTAGGPHVQEERDSVTVTSVMKYFVLPDPAISPLYTVSNITDFSNVKSTFDWVIKNTKGTGSSTTPIISVTWSATGIDSLKVKETPTVGAACAGKETVIPVAIISKPTITFNQIGSVYADGKCHTQTEVNAGIAYQFPVTPATESSQVQVDYTMVFTPTTGTAVTTSATNVPVKSGILAITLSNTGNEYGKYEITITRVTDRVSRKSGVASTNDLLTSGGSASFTYTVMAPAKTGPIYRLPNNF